MILQDLHGRTIDRMRISVTDRCGLSCVYCKPGPQPPWVSRDELLTYEEIDWIVRRMRERFGLRRVRLTGGEPLGRPHLDTLVKMLSGAGLEEISLTTNGQDLARRIGGLAAAGLGRVNVSLDSLDPERYRRITGGDLRRTLDGIDAADRSGLRPLKINTVVIRENLCEVESLAEWAVGRGHEIRFLELMAIGSAGERHRRMFVSTSEVLARLEGRFRLEPIGAEPGAPARRMRIEGDGIRGIVGFISPESDPFCGECRRLRMTATGKLLGCLMHDDGVDLKAVVRACGPDGPDGGVDTAAFDHAVRTAVGLKPQVRIRSSGGRMAQIGG